VNNQVSSASEAQKLKNRGGDNVLPGQCCHTPEGAVIREHGKMLDSRTDRENRRNVEEKKFASVPFMHHESHTK